MQPREEVPAQHSQVTVSGAVSTPMVIASVTGHGMGPVEGIPSTCTSLCSDPLDQQKRHKFRNTVRNLAPLQGLPNQVRVVSCAPVTSQCASPGTPQLMIPRSQTVQPHMSMLGIPASPTVVQPRAQMSTSQMIPSPAIVQTHALPDSPIASQVASTGPASVDAIPPGSMVCQLGSPMSGSNTAQLMQVPSPGTNLPQLIPVSQVVAVPVAQAAITYGLPTSAIATTSQFLLPASSLATSQPSSMLKSAISTSNPKATSPMTVHRQSPLGNTVVVGHVGSTCARTAMEMNQRATVPVSAQAKSGGQTVISWNTCKITATDTNSKTTSPMSVQGKTWSANVVARSTAAPSTPTNPQATVFVPPPVSLTKCGGQRVVIGNPTSIITTTDKSHEAAKSERSSSVAQKCPSHVQVAPATIVTPAVAMRVNNLNNPAIVWQVIPLYEDLGGPKTPVSTQIPTPVNTGSDMPTDAVNKSKQLIPETPEGKQKVEEIVTNSEPASGQLKEQHDTSSLVCRVLPSKSPGCSSSKVDSAALEGDTAGHVGPLHETCNQGSTISHDNALDAEASDEIKSSETNDADESAKRVPLSNESVKPENMFICPVCNICLHVWEEYYAHASCHAGILDEVSVYTCSLCHVQYSHKMMMDEHMEAKHSDHENRKFRLLTKEVKCKKWCCELCGALYFDSAKELAMHLSKAHQMSRIDLGNLLDSDEDEDDPVTCKTEIEEEARSETFTNNIKSEFNLEGSNCVKEENGTFTLLPSLSNLDGSKNVKEENDAGTVLPSESNMDGSDCKEENSTFTVLPSESNLDGLNCKEEEKTTSTVVPATNTGPKLELKPSVSYNLDQNKSVKLTDESEPSQARNQRTATRPRERERSNVLTAATYNTFQCHLCQRSFTILKAFHSHLLNGHGYVTKVHVFRCDQCFWHGTSQELVHEHHQRKHPSLPFVMKLGYIEPANTNGEPDIVYSAHPPVNTGQRCNVPEAHSSNVYKHTVELAEDLSCVALDVSIKKLPAGDGVESSKDKPETSNPKLYMPIMEDFKDLSDTKRVFTDSPTTKEEPRGPLAIDRTSSYPPTSKEASRDIPVTNHTFVNHSATDDKSLHPRAVNEPSVGYTATQEASICTPATPEATICPAATPEATICPAATPEATICPAATPETSICAAATPLVPIDPPAMNTGTIYSSSPSKISSDGTKHKEICSTSAFIPSGASLEVAAVSAEEELFQCPSCAYKSKSKSCLKHHMKRHAPPKAMAFRCFYCNFESVSQSPVTRHIRTFHKNMEVKVVHIESSTHINHLPKSKVTICRGASQSNLQANQTSEKEGNDARSETEMLAGQQEMVQGTSKSTVEEDGGSSSDSGDEDGDDDDDDYATDSSSDSNKEEEEHQKAGPSAAQPILVLPKDPHTPDKYSRRLPGFTMFKCNFCEFKARSRSKVQRHYYYQHISYRPFRCGYCIFDAVESSKIRRHCEAVHIGKPVKVVDRQTQLIKDSINKAVQAREARTTDQFPPDEKLNNALAVYVEKLGVYAYRCKECGYEQEVVSSVKNHVLSVHMKFAPYNCGYCPYKSVALNKVKNHCKNVHANRKIIVHRQMFEEASNQLVPPKNNRNLPPLSEVCDNDGSESQSRHKEQPRNRTEFVRTGTVLLKHDAQQATGAEGADGHKTANCTKISETGTVCHRQQTVEVDVASEDNDLDERAARISTTKKKHDETTQMADSRADKQTNSFEKSQIHRRMSDTERRVHMQVKQSVQCSSLERPSQEMKVCCLDREQTAVSDEIASVTKETDTHAEKCMERQSSWSASQKSEMEEHMKKKHRQNSGERKKSEHKDKNYRRAAQAEETCRKRDDRETSAKEAGLSDGKNSTKMNKRRLSCEDKNRKEQQASAVEDFLRKETMTESSKNGRKKERTSSVEYCAQKEGRKQRDEDCSAKATISDGESCHRKESFEPFGKARISDGESSPGKKSSERSGKARNSDGKRSPRNESSERSGRARISDGESSLRKESSERSGKARISDGESSVRKESSEPFGKARISGAESSLRKERKQSKSEDNSATRKTKRSSSIEQSSLAEKTVLNGALSTKSKSSCEGEKSSGKERRDSNVDSEGRKEKNSKIDNKAGKEGKLSETASSANGKQKPVRDDEDKRRTSVDEFTKKEKSSGVSSLARKERKLSDTDKGKRRESISVEDKSYERRVSNHEKLPTDEKHSGANRFGKTEKKFSESDMSAKGSRRESANADHVSRKETPESLTSKPNSACAQAVASQSLSKIEMLKAAWGISNLTKQNIPSQLAKSPSHEKEHGKSQRDRSDTSGRERDSGNAMNLSKEDRAVCVATPKLDHQKRHGKPERDGSDSVNRKREDVHSKKEKPTEKSFASQNERANSATKECESLVSEKEAYKDPHKDKTAVKNSRSDIVTETTDTANAVKDGFIPDNKRNKTEKRVPESSSKHKDLLSPSRVYLQKQKPHKDDVSMEPKQGHACDSPMPEQVEKSSKEKVLAAKNICGNSEKRDLEKQVAMQRNKNELLQTASKKESGKVVGKEANWLKTKLNEVSSGKILKYECSVCGFKVKEKHKMKYHIMEEMNYKPIQCFQCPYRAVNMDKIEEHYRQEHGHRGDVRTRQRKDDQRLEDRVKRRLKNAEAYETAEKETTGNTEHEKLPAENSQEKSLQTAGPSNILSDSPANNNRCQTKKQETVGYLCKKCGFETKHRKKMRSHIMEELGYKPYSCVNCDFSGTDHDSIVEHSRQKHQNITNKAVSAHYKKCEQKQMQVETLLKKYKVKEQESFQQQDLFVPDSVVTQAPSRRRSSGSKDLPPHTLAIASDAASMSKIVPQSEDSSKPKDLSKERPKDSSSKEDPCMIRKDRLSHLGKSHEKEQKNKSSVQSSEKMCRTLAERMHKKLQKGKSQLGLKAESMTGENIGKVSSMQTPPGTQKHIGEILSPSSSIKKKLKLRSVGNFVEILGKPKSRTSAVHMKENEKESCDGGSPCKEVNQGPPKRVSYHEGDEPVEKRRRLNSDSSAGSGHSLHESLDSLYSNFTSDSDSNSQSCESLTSRLSGHSDQDTEKIKPNLKRKNLVVMPQSNKKAKFEGETVEYSCKACPEYKCEGKKAMTSHLQIKHASPSLQCKICQFKTWTEKKMQEHMWLRHGCGQSDQPSYTQLKTPPGESILELWKMLVQTGSSPQKGQGQNQGVPVASTKKRAWTVSTNANEITKQYTKDKDGIYHCSLCTHTSKKSGHASEHFVVKHLPPRFRCFHCAFTCSFGAHMRAHYKNKSHQGKPVLMTNIDDGEVYQGPKWRPVNQEGEPGRKKRVKGLDPNK